MLRFDIPRVRSNVVRLEALLTHVFCWLTLLVSPWFLLVPLLDGGLRGFFSFLEWALSFCAACWIYGAWYRRFPPNMSRRGPRAALSAGAASA